jgi:hypothetical protein
MKTQPEDALTTNVLTLFLTFQVSLASADTAVLAFANNGSLAFVSLTLLHSTQHNTPHARCYRCRALEFLITTGPGPVPRLDGINPVIGRVESGMDTVIRLSKVIRHIQRHTAGVMANTLAMSTVWTSVCMWSTLVTWAQSSGCHRS